MPADDLPHHAGNDTYPALLCSPFGICEPCPENAVSRPPYSFALIHHSTSQLEEPFCQPFGNRRLMHCANTTSSEDTSGTSAPPSHTKSQHPQGEILAWESCGRIVGQERADFYEFVACNITFAIIALVVLFTRSKRLHAMQARQLAARIGIIRSGGNGGRR